MRTHAAVPRLALLAALPLATSCGKDILPAYDLELTVMGNASPVAVGMEWSGGTESLMLSADGTAAFDSQLGVGTSLTLRGPTECHFRNGEPTLSLTTTTTVTQVTLACPGVLDVATLGLSLPLSVRRDAGAFTVGLPALLADANPIVTLTPTMRYPGLKLTVNDAGGGKGDLTTDRLRVGANKLRVELPDYRLERLYNVQLERAATAKEVTKLAGTSAGASFGVAVAAFGARVVIGEPGAAFGRAYVYRAEATATGTMWQLEDTLEPPAAAGANSGFGEALAMTADRIVVGAPRADDPATDVGAAYVFTRSGNDWTLLRRHTFAVGGSRFGSALALSPTGLLVVGAPGESAGEANTGSAYAYPNADNATSVVLQARHRDGDDEFGKSVAILDTTIYVGMPGDDSGAMSAATPPTTDDAAAPNSGVVYAFSLAGTTATVTRFLKQGAPMSNARFGDNVAAHGTSALAISRAQPTWSVDCYGAGLVSRGTISIGNPISALSVNADRVAVAHRTAGTGTELRVSAYRLQVDGSTPATLAPAFASAGTMAADGFARALAFGGDVLHIGAPRQGATATGASYVFE